MANVAAAAARRAASTGFRPGKPGGIVQAIMGRKNGQGGGSRLESLEQRVGALEEIKSEVEANEPAAGAVSQAANQASEAAATAQAMSGELPAPATPGRFSDGAKSTAAGVFGTLDQRQSSVGMLPAGVAASEETIANISELMQEQNV